MLTANTNYLDEQNSLIMLPPQKKEVTCKVRYDDDESYSFSDSLTDEHKHIKMEIASKKGVVYSKDNNSITVSFNEIMVDFPDSIFNAKTVEIGQSISYKIYENESKTRFQEIEIDKTSTISKKFQEKKEQLLSLIDSI